MSRRKKDDRRARRRIGDNIARRRAELGIGRAECARRAEVSVSELSGLEGGERQPLASTLQKIAAALGCDVSDLLSGVRWVMVGEGSEEGHIEVDRRRR
jgi:transcriptional regulator with XRE-family HTH domain